MKNRPLFRFAAAALLVFGAAVVHAETIYGVSDETFELVSFDSATPASFTTIGAVSGLVSGHTLRAIDFRPSTGQLYAVSSIADATTGAAQLYTVDLATAALTAVGSPFALLTASARVSIDFNPVVDRIRLVTGAGDNLRLNPITGAIAATDTGLAFVAGDPNAGENPLVAGIAYTNNVAGATSTTLYAYEFQNDIIATVGSVGGSPTSPNSGELTTVGSLGGPSASGGDVGFDISGVTGVAYLSLDDFPSDTVQDEFYTVNLATGATTLVAEEIGIDLLDISAAPVPEPGTMAVLGLGALAVMRRRRKA